ncbi:MAG: outer membrane protein assembly factor BamA [Deltaproteobacteria bacterium]
MITVGHRPAAADGLLPEITNILIPGNGARSNYLVRYTGNTFFTVDELDKMVKPELEDIRRAKYKESVIDDAAFLIETQYRQQGFVGVRVEYQYDQTASPNKIVFNISEGKRVLVRSISVVGNSYFDTDRLLAVNPEISAYLKKGKPFPLVEEQLSDLASDIRSLYLSEGFIDCKLSGPEYTFTADGTDADVLYRVQEGRRFTIGKVRVAGDYGSKLDAELKKLSNSLAGQVFYQRRRLLLASKVTEIFQQFGYPFAQAEVEAVLNAATSTVDLTVTVSPGDKVKVGKILIEGNERTGTHFIESRLRLKTGELYSLNKRRQSFRNLYETGLFSSVSIDLVELKPGETETTTRDVIVRVEEKKARELYLEPGWGSYELFRLAAGYKDRNIFGTGRILRFDSVASTKGRSLEVGFTDPWFLNTKVSADFPVTYLYREEPSFTQEKTGVGALFTRDFRKKISLTAGYRLSRNNITDVGPYVDQEKIDTNYSTGVLSLQLVRDSRNDIFFPTGGYRGFVSGEIAVSPLGSEISFYRLTTGVRYFLQLPKEIVLGMRYATGFVLPLDNQIGIPLGERFFNGGENSVRSFRESRLGPLDQSGNALGGTAYNIISIELRKKLVGNFAGSVFVDVGNISPNRFLADGSTPLAADRATLTRATFNEYFRDMRFGIGCGLQYLLPVGPARLDFAVNPSPNKDRHEDSYALHFSIGMAF